MAVRLLIDADVRGQRQVDNLNRSIRNVDTNSGRLGRSLRNIRTALIGIGAVAGFARLAQEAASAADSITGIENQLRAAGVEAARIPQVLAQTRDLANDTRASLDATGNLYARILRSTRDLGISQQEALDITRSFQQSLALSGASTQEAAAASLQFGQALASGRLQGDELRSILENNSFFARSLAEELGVGVGELRQMGAEGLLTSDILADVALRLAPMMNQQFQELTPTFAQATTVLSNGFQDVLNDIALTVDETLGLRAGLLEAGNALTDFFGQEGDQVSGLFARIPDVLTDAFLNTDYQAIASGAIGALNDGVDAFFDALIAFPYEQSLAGFAQTLDDIDFFAIFVDAGAALINAVERLVEFLLQIDWLNVLGSLAIAMTAVARDFVNGIINIDWQAAFAAAFEQASALVNGIASGIQDGLTQAFNFVGNIFVAILNAALSQLEEGVNALLDLLPSGIRGLTGTGAGISIDRVSGFGDQEGQAPDFMSSIVQPITGAVDAIVDAATMFVDNTIGASIESGEMFRQQVGEAANATTEAAEAGMELIEEIVGGEEGEDGLLARIFNFSDAQFADISETFRDGVQGAFEDAFNTGNFSDLASGIFESFTMAVNEQFASNIADVFQGIFNSFFDDMEGNALTSVFSAIGGFFQGGGVVPGSGPVPIVAHGGEVVLNREQQQRLLNGEAGGMTTVNLGITGDISRQTRSEIMQMLPMIANGVNQYNAEQGVR